MAIDITAAVPGQPLSVLKHVMAYGRGKRDRNGGSMRITPYYEEKEIRDGRSVDVTDELDEFWYAGYDGLPMPKAKR